MTGWLRIGDAAGEYAFVNFNQVCAARVWPKGSQGGNKPDETQVDLTLAATTDEPLDAPTLFHGRDADRIVVYLNGIADDVEGTG